MSGTITREREQRSVERPETLERLPGARRRRMLLVVNPHASSVSERLRGLVAGALEGRFEVSAVDTRARGHATELCRTAAEEGYEVVVAFGGDGTVNEAANGLLGGETPLCCLPGGSANVFARMLGIPHDAIDATEHLLAMADDWRVRRVDLGVVNGRCFTFASGLGLDATVVERVDANPRMKARLGPYYFAWKAMTTFVGRYLLARPPRLHLDAGGHTLRGVTAVVQNGSPFTYFQARPIDVAEGATLDSGSLASGILHRATPLTMPSIAWRALSPGRRISGHRQVTGLADMRELTVRSADGRLLPLQVDGDYLGDVPEARYSVLAGALRVVG